MFTSYYIQNNSKCINNLNISIKSTKLLEESIELNLYDIGIKNGFLDMTPKTWATKKRIDKWTSTELKTFIRQRIL